MSDKPTQQQTEPSLMARYDALPTAKKALVGKLVIAYAMTLHTVKAAASLPDDGLASSLGSFISSVEPK